MVFLMIISVRLMSYLKVNGPKNGNTQWAKFDKSAIDQGSCTAYLKAKIDIFGKKLFQDESASK